MYFAAKDDIEHNDSGECCLLPPRLNIRVPLRILVYVDSGIGTGHKMASQSGRENGTCSIGGYDKGVDNQSSGDETNNQCYPGAEPLPPPLDSLDRNFRCTICDDYLRSAVMLSVCGHSFCSECIRNAFRFGVSGTCRRPKCPACRRPVTTPNVDSVLVPNRALQESVQCWKDSLPALLSVAKTSDSPRERQKRLPAQHDDNKNKNKNKKKNSSATLETAVPSQSSSSRHRPPGRIRKRKVASYEDDPGDDGNDDSDSDDDYIGDDDKSNNKYSANKYINTDNTRGRSTNKRTPCAAEACPSLPKRRPATTYTGLKRKKLMELCKAEGLNTSGTDDQLKERHRNFIMLWNAEADSVLQGNLRLTPPQIANLVHERERAQAKASIVPSAVAAKQSIKRITASRATLGKDGTAKVTSGSAKYDSAFWEQFYVIILSACEKSKNTVGPSRFSKAIQRAQDSIAAIRARKSTNVANDSGVAVQGLASSGQSSTVVTECKLSAPVPVVSRKPTPAKSTVLDLVGDGSGGSAPIVSSKKQLSAAPIFKRQRVTKKDPVLTLDRRAWDCHVCTFRNGTQSWAPARCQMCGSKKQ